MTPRKVDANQAAIVAALRAAGCGVIDAHTLGDDIPDLIVSYWTGGPITVLMEVKSAGGKLSDGQTKFQAAWPGLVYTVWSAEDALRQIGKV